jgi:DNA-binding beta-propeller fold protein YncE
VLGTFNVGTSPQFVVFDGANMWVENQGSNTITELSDCNGTLLGTFRTGNQPTGIAFDGANVWVSNTKDGTISKR